MAHALVWEDTFQAMTGGEFTALVGRVVERIEKSGWKLVQVPRDGSASCSNGSFTHYFEGQLICPSCGLRGIQTPAQYDGQEAP